MSKFYLILICTKLSNKNLFILEHLKTKMKRTYRAVLLHKEKIQDIYLREEDDLYLFIIQILNVEV